MRSRAASPSALVSLSPSPWGPTLIPILLCLTPVRQYADICLFNTAQYKCPVAVEDAE